ncbi:MAG: PLP-dependent aminotransferase family protein [Rhizobacter sp.]|nr:PLP-dependent aminotransferase family protein [Rhizobacter sp.]
MRPGTVSVRPTTRSVGASPSVAAGESAALASASDTTLAEQLTQRYAERIRQRLLAPGARLPSVRECARMHGVSPATVVAAYDQLQACGLVEARRQRGFFVRDGEPPSLSALHASAAPAPVRPLPNSATALIRAMFVRPGDRAMPGLGTLPAEWLDAPMLGAAMRRATAALQRDATSLHYGDPAGEPRLRAALAAKVAEFSIAAAPAQIATTVGATHALDVVTRTLLRTGDSVLVDEPGWSVEYARLAALGMRVLPVPRGGDGPDVAAMRRLIEAQPAEARPRLYVTVSVLHNPTGASLSLQAAHRVLRLAAEFDLHIAEDDTYAHLAPAHAPRLAALDALERTIYVSGFSKILTPNWRVGFLVAPPALFDRLVDTKLLTTLATPSSGELALAHCLEQGWLRRHAERVRERLATARTRTVRLVESHGCRLAAPPNGLFGWVDAGVDTERLARELLDDWLIAPGALFHAQPRPSTMMRINFATSQDPRFWKAVVAARARLGGAR